MKGFLEGVVGGGYFGGLVVETASEDFEGCVSNVGMYRKRWWLRIVGW